MRINETVVDSRGWHYAVSGHNDFATIARWEGDWWALKWSGDPRHERITDVPPEVVSKCMYLINNHGTHAPGYASAGVATKEATHENRSP